MRKHDEVERLLADAERAQRCGMTSDMSLRRALYRRCASGEVVKPYPSLFFDAEAWEQLDAKQRTLYVARALQLIHPPWVFAGLTAADAYGLEYRRVLHDGGVDLASDVSPVASKNPKLRYLPEACREAEKRSEVSVVPITRVLLECGRRYSFRDALPMYDSAFRLGLVTRAEMEQMGAGIWGIQDLLTYADPASENGGESFCRGTMIEEGFPVPRLQVEYPKPDGSVYRVDFLYQLRTGRSAVIEFDGMDKYIDPEMTRGQGLEEVVSREQQRERFLLQECDVSQVVRLRYGDVLNRQEMVRKLIDAGVPCSKMANVL
ncbi:hypothetical protein [Bifidobacterium sp. ESL0790]|uniref:hypothetical protein n=1 Tax=Bifidobacterium sp. ESL0790 TaxID=2983233 RepID=UPI0023F79327|nr:hypothetical protein [Bifidobacterium sp. ESL0790]WEV72323.1 hypothetical protein OZY47_07845 [Bifidobacterium sp. ESL0790]